ncbi:lysozyme [Yersinia mollaretii]|uniref:lysozyme n=1 Tax=Yersinia mollaretii TaxID=33060 RepID=UPI000C14A1BC|nr:lysozyme [Yersinia mollaretii]MDA5529131.1 lysozyme [Yersinia mollaretii]MDR7875845.1 lysozyme [Yersinia mollaretii]PHZ29554.1 muraminidase [Yersinia mollaretii]WQC73774.1 lysozyme [Yersinia mollaretii]WQC74034.1 lysozyme [Yersinia mollaretii]
MRISENGISKLKGEEGERLTGYKDSRGIPTVGVGHTGVVDGKPVAVGMVISKDKSSELLRSDLAWVEKSIATNVKSPLTQNQYDALCSLIFNIGPTAFANSSVLKRLNAGDYKGAADAFLMWKKAGNNPDILLPRRQRERALFLS